MLVLWPVISWLNQEMPIIVNRSWGPQSSCRLHRLSYIFARYPRISVVYFVCVTSSCLPKSFNLLIDVLSYVRVPTCPSFNPISSLRAFEPSHHISPSLSYLPILTPISPLRSIALYQPIAIPLAHPPIRYHHFDSSHYISPSLPHLPILQSDSSLRFISPSLSHLPILQSDFITSRLRTIAPHQPIAILLAHPYSDIITSIHCTISAHRATQYIPRKIFIVRTEYCVDVVVV